MTIQYPLSFRSIISLFYGALVVVSLSMTGCYSRKEPQSSSNHPITTRPSGTKTSVTVNNEQQVASQAPLVSAEVVPRNYSTPLPGTVVTDLTIPGGIVRTSENNRPQYGENSLTKGPGGFNDGAGASALNLHQELMNTRRPHDASTRISDPAIPSAIPSDEVAVNTDFTKPSSYGAYNAGIRPSPPQKVSPTQKVSPPHKVSGGRYVVTKGDTLYSIARKHNVSVSQILSANDSLNNPDQLQVGQDLLIP